MCANKKWKATTSTSRIVDDHKASMHVEITIIDEPEESNQCSECDKNFASTHNLSVHKETNHGNKILVDKSYMDNILAENKRMINEVRNLKDDFERLNDIFETSKNNANNTVHSNDVELAKVREEFRTVKAENVLLLEKNETLFKLGNVALGKKNLMMFLKSK